MALIIFVRNPRMGEVKTRLAQGIGNALALEVYKGLMRATRRVALKYAGARYLFYDQKISENDLWLTSDFGKFIQQGPDLGERMKNAFSKVFSEEHKKAIIVGSDCPDLRVNHVNEAENLLVDHDVVLGPTFDGGYYLLGLKEMHTALFENIKWSTGSVFQNTLDICKENNLKVAQLEALSDVDTKEDLLATGFMKEIIENNKTQNNNDEYIS